MMTDSKELTIEMVRGKIIPMLEAWCDGRLYGKLGEFEGKDYWLPVSNGDGGGVMFEARATKKNFVIEFRVHDVNSDDIRGNEGCRIDLNDYFKIASDKDVIEYNNR